MNYKLVLLMIDYQKSIGYQDMFKFYFLAATAGLTLATYHNHQTLFPNLIIQLPPFLQQYTNKWFTVQKAQTITSAPKKAVVEDYIQISQSGNQRIIYSKLHKRPLAVHQLIVKPQMQQEKKQQKLKQQVNITNSVQQQIATSEISKQVPLSETISTLSSNKSETESELTETKSSKNQALYKNFFNTYAKQLITTQQCESVELISGPIYSKDTQYKTKKEGQQKKEVLDNVYVSYLKISPNGEYLTDRFYTIVVCNSTSREKYINGFTIRRSYASETFKLTNYLTSLKRLQEQTGLAFNLQGEPLTLIDYKGINRDRLYSDFEAK